MISVGVESYLIHLNFRLVLRRKFGDDALDLSNFIVNTQPPITVPLTPIYNLQYTI